MSPLRLRKHANVAKPNLANIRLAAALPRSFRSLALASVILAAAMPLCAQSLTPDQNSLWGFAEFGPIQQVQDLLEKQHINPNFINRALGSPLYAAITNDHLDIATILLDRGAQPDLGNNYDETPLMVAARKADPAALELLLAHGAKPNAQDKAGRTALSNALAVEKLDNAKLLAEAGAVLPPATVLSDLMQDGATETGKIDVLRFLLDHGANPDTQDRNDNPMLRDAIHNNQTGAAALLLDHGAAVEWRGKYGSGPLLDDAASESGPEIVKLLLDHHANIHASDKFGQESAIRIACNQSPSVASVKVLIEHGAEIHKPYVLAAAVTNYVKGGPEITKYLLERGVDVNAADKDGNTALMFAAGAYRPVDSYGWQNDVVKLLLEHGAKKDVANANGKTAIDLAEGQSNCNAVALLDAAPYTRTAQCLISAPGKLKVDRNDSVYVKFDMFKKNFASMMPMVVATASALPHPLEIPEEAHKLYVQANVTLKAAQDPEEMHSALDLYDQAIRLCPWYTDAWYNLSLALEKANDFASAKIAMSYAMGMEPQLAGNQATQERQYTLEAQQQLADQRQQRQKELDDDADHVRQIIGGHTMYRFWVFGDASFAHCTMQAATQGTCLAFDSTRAAGNVGNGHNGTSLGSVAAVSTENNKVVLSLGTQRFCIPPQSAHSLEIQASWGFSNNQVLGITDCDHPDQKLYNLNVLPAGNSYIMGGDGKTKPTTSGTVQVTVERCTDDACTNPDISFYWYK
jgi:ankyrin repeat protein